jgi:hypothetical protein
MNTFRCPSTSVYSATSVPAMPDGPLFRLPNRSLYQKYAWLTIGPGHHRSGRRFWQASRHEDCSARHRGLDHLPTNAAIFRTGPVVSLPDALRPDCALVVLGQTAVYRVRCCPRPRPSLNASTSPSRIRPAAVPIDAMDAVNDFISRPAHSTEPTGTRPLEPPRSTRGEERKIPSPPPRIRILFPRCAV